MFISINLMIRFLLELILLASLGVWGYHFAAGTFSRIVLTAGLPLTAAIIWGLFISPKARISLPIAAVVFIEFSLVGMAAYGLIWSGYLVTAIVYTILHIGNRLLLLFVNGKNEDLLKPFIRK
ncbi:YrdB family protein [Paenibacillus radicis (ex Xue et al. 2023)]|uniref:YrdB family protein n=1 Tax=Paenibacillus radicis (ex Xue et al. 2023) TaxID=2972489 RepID=A0ABT1YAF2_9BACL|nr:YrdB family protein [Paenibacillus radicis (ex Xue et al. 2023)]MCR8630174.1 YrdB family protein [Paenibacillus radicis (ex Xue et al. 2023)]